MRLVRVRRLNREPKNKKKQQKRFRDDSVAATENTDNSMLNEVETLPQTMFYDSIRLLFVGACMGLSMIHR